MEHVRFGRELQLMTLLTQNYEYSVEQISNRIGMSRRTIYRYLESFKQMGFIVEKQGTVYRLDKDSPFFDKISSKVHFTEDEAMTLAEALNAVHTGDSQVRALREKLASLYDYKVLRKHNFNERLALNINRLYEAIKQERTVVLHRYNSPSSGTTSNRIVEPFAFLSGNSEVRCYEVMSHRNKTFKVARIGQVETLDLFWSHKDEHKMIYTDLFGFSSENPVEVKLRLSKLAATVLVEELPDAATQMKPEKDGRSLFATKVSDYRGVGRFVMGMAGEVEIVDSPDFKNYLTNQIALLTEKLKL